MSEGTPVSNTWAALRQRKLVQWALAYAAAAWVVLQVLGLASASYAWPPAVMRLSFGVLALGLVATLVLAWYHGERGEQKIRGSELLILTLLLVVGGGVLWRSERSASPRPSPRPKDAVNAPMQLAPAPGVVWPVSAVPAKSVAVLPFENLSEDKANAYFASGMQDEILTRLAGIRDLKVISRNSTAKYASRPDDLKTVGQQLGVATVLEGSVQKAGNTVRVTAQLIDAQSDSQLWAETYDRDIENIFAVQSDVAEKVASALKAQLLPAETARVARIPTLDQAAYDLYLRAGARANRAYDQVVLAPRELPAAIVLYQQALARDPSFALAAAALSRAHMYMYWFAPDRSEARLASAKAAAEQALALQPDLGEGHLALGMYYYWGYRDYARALQQLPRARKELPNSADVEVFLASIARRQGQWKQAIAGFQQAAVIDPRSAYSLDQLGWSYSMLRRYAEADQAYARAVFVAPDPANELVTRALNTVFWKGDLAPLGTALNALARGSDVYIANAARLFRLKWLSRDYAAAVKVAEADAAANWVDQSNAALPRSLYLAWADAAAGNSARARSRYAELRSRMQAALRQRPDDPDLHLALGFADAGLGLSDEALLGGRKATSLMPVSRDAITGPAYLGLLAQLYVRVGDKDQALALLQQLLEMPAGTFVSPALLKLDPVWDPLRSDPRFNALLKKYASVASQ